jgi:8-oxo-dGTP pyrophosphatase MutT (NUDIX family)
VDHKPSLRGRVIIVEDGKIALIKRVRDGRTYYVFPGGAVEVGETSEEAAAREAVEELGLRVEVGRLVAVQQFQGCEHRFYTARVLGGTFGSGNGPEYSQQRDPHDTLYLPVWLEVGKLDEFDVRPPAIAVALRSDEIKRWRGRRIDEE